MLPVRFIDDGEDPTTEITSGGSRQRRMCVVACSGKPEKGAAVRALEGVARSNGTVRGDRKPATRVGPVITLPEFVGFESIQWRSEVVLIGESKDLHGTRQ